LKPDGRKISIPSSELKLGDIIEIHPHQRIPADLVLLYSSDENGTIFIKTDQLDGETDWKLRRSIRYTQKFFSSNNFNLGHLNGLINYQPPSENIYHFEGVFEVQQDNSSDKVAEPLFLENTLWANTAITSGFIYAVVIYTGSETRISRNARQPRSKIGKLELELNLISKLLFFFMIILAGVIVALNGFYAFWYLQYFRYILLMASIIPISLRVNLDFAKAVASYKIGKDDAIKGTVARNSTIPEELGRISYLLTDKTGTLTKNEMHFKKLVLEYSQFDEENLGFLVRSITKQCEKSEGPMKDVEEKYNESKGPINIDQIKKSSSSKVRRDKDSVLRDLITALSVCHNVTPLMENGEKIYHASSPDEVALVKFAEECNMRLIQRTNDSMRIENSAKIIEDYEILANFPFSSETKRMGILVRHVESQRIVFFLKGADSAVQPKVIYSNYHNNDNIRSKRYIDQFYWMNVRIWQEQD
jgi:phospholipid-translocating ATPase